MYNNNFFFLDEDGEKSVSVLLDAEESELIFLDKSNAVSSNKYFIVSKFKTVKL